ncbi:MAG: hypothetical protein ACXWQR_13605 [Ktedonobacterales bacterium]
MWGRWLAEVALPSPQFAADRRADARWLTIPNAPSITCEGTRRDKTVARQITTSDVRASGKLSETTIKMTRALLACGVVAGPIYIVVGAIQAATRAGLLRWGNGDGRCTHWQPA